VAGGAGAVIRFGELAYPDHFERRRAIAVYLVERFRRLRSEEGTRAAAARLRKYGVPLELALLILGVSPSYRLPPRGGHAPPRR
jgi:hypothetical protein